jgi:hypothetical protein
MMAPIDPRDFGRLEAEVLNLQKQVAAMAADMTAVRSLLDQTKGGWQVIVAVAGLTSAITVLAIKILPLWPFR